MFDRLVVASSRAREKHYLNKQIDMNDYEQDWCKKKEANEGQLDLKDRQLDWAPQEQLALRCASGRNHKVKPEDEEANPNGRDSHGRVVERLLQRFDVKGI
jgi:hypothetical protein